MLGHEFLHRIVYDFLFFVIPFFFGPNLLLKQDMHKLAFNGRVIHPLESSGFKPQAEGVVKGGDVGQRLRLAVAVFFAVLQFIRRGFGVSRMPERTIVALSPFLKL